MTGIVEQYAAHSFDICISMICFDQASLVSMHHEEVSHLAVSYLGIWFSQLDCICRKTSQLFLGREFGRSIKAVALRARLIDSRTGIVATKVMRLAVATI